MSKNTMRVGIVGGGIGGVALARALRLRGIDAWVFERAGAFGEIGAGVQMTPNAAKVLRALGLGDALTRIGFLPNAMVGRNWDDAIKRLPGDGESSASVKAALDAPDDAD